MFWGNLFGVVLGLTLGAYFGRAGGLMGIMDGAMGGVMGGAMGAMLSVMMVFPREGLLWTGVLLGLIYVAGMVGLVALIEQSAPGHAALHRVLPMFTRAVAEEIAEEAEAAMERSPNSQRRAKRIPVQPAGRSQNRSIRKQQRNISSVLLLGSVAVAAVLVVLTWWALSADTSQPGQPGAGTLRPTNSGFVGAAGETQAQLEQQAVVAQIGADCTQTTDVVLNSSTFQYEPKVIKVKQGIPVRFNLSAINGDPG
jgi:hypothetical protein